MTISKESLNNDISSILDNRFIFNNEKISTIPQLDDNKPTLYWNDWLSFCAAILMIDIRGSTKIFNSHNDNVIAKILMSYHKWVTKIAKDFGGKIRSFNWDSVLIFFEWNTKGAINEAVRCAMKISYFIKYILNPKLTSKWYTNIDFWIWLDHDDILSVKVWIQWEWNRDLVWISKAVNLSAKLSDLWKAPYNIFISNKIYINLFDDTKYHNNKDNFWNTQKLDMWEYQYININWELKNLYKTNYHWGIW